MIKAQQLIDILNKGIKEEALGIYVHNKVKVIIAKWDGKLITKRIANDLQKSEPTWRVVWRPQYGMYHLEIDVFNGQLGMRHFSILVGYDTDPVVKADKFEDFDGCNGSAAEKRNVTRQAIISDIPRLLDMTVTINQLNTLIPKLRTHFDGFTNPEAYKMRELIDLDKNSGIW